MDTQLEEARRCPWCHEPGVKVNSIKAQPGGDIKRGTFIDTYKCENSRCENKDERWAIQINPDGTIPPYGTRANQDKYWDINRVTTFQQRQRARDQLAQLYESQVKN